MITKEIAEILNGLEYCEDIKPMDIKYAKDNGVVIVFGASDDLMEFRGAIDDEAGCYGGGLVYFNRSGELISKCNDIDCPYFDEIKEKASKIEAVWDSEGYAWTYKTDIPHETFDIIDDGFTYCRGIVFLIDDVKED